ncbi:organic hydroperoxide resistance protein [Gorgonomyces haynaldii]|nr:organic hydroperoxide resistance protein [Gorgonomyces haynaldii]
MLRRLARFQSTFQPLYTAESTARGGGRNGSVKSSDSILNFELSVPKGLGGPGLAKTNPEQLFSAGYAACFKGALDLVSKNNKFALPQDTTVTAQVTIGRGADGLDLQTHLTVRAVGADHAKLADVVEKAHQVCPYSRATKGNMPVKLTVLTN